MFSSAFSKAASTKAKSRFLTKNDLQAASSRFRRAEASLEAARWLSKESSSLVQGAIEAISVKFPELYSLPDSNEISTLDVAFYIKLVSYCLVAGGTAPVDEHFLANLDEIKADFLSYNLSLAQSIEVLKTILNYIKANHGLVGQAAEETNKYIDYMLNGLSN